MTDSEIRALVLEELRTGSELQYEKIRRALSERCASENLTFGSIQNVQLKRVLWDLAVERIISWGTETDSEATWPCFHVTPFGRDYLASTGPHFLDVDGYLKYLRTLVPDTDTVIIQYTHEAVRAFRSQLWFAAAVMLGAASERSILLLLEAILDWTSDGKEKARLTKLLAQPRLGEIFKAIQASIADQARSGHMPYSVHQGSTEHLLSFSEMIRVQRNDAVHPHAGIVDRQRVFLSLQSFPGGLEILERIRQWYASGL